MNPFNTALGKVHGAVSATFDSDDELNIWLADINSSESSKREQAEALLRFLMDRIGTGWIAALFVNDERQEEEGVVAEAVMTEVRALSDRTSTRKVFAYELAARILNKGVRPLNRSAKKLLPSVEIDTFIEASTPSAKFISEEEHARYDALAISYLSSEMRSNSVTSPEIIINVKKAWWGAVSELDAESGGNKVKATSAAVKERVAEKTKYPLNVVEAAMKRYIRAIREVRSREIQAEVSRRAGAKRPN